MAGPRLPASHWAVYPLTGSIFAAPVLSTGTDQIIDSEIFGSRPVLTAASLEQAALDQAFKLWPPAQREAGDYDQVDSSCYRSSLKMVAVGSRQAEAPAALANQLDRYPIQLGLNGNLTMRLPGMRCQVARQRRPNSTRAEKPVGQKQQQARPTHHTEPTGQRGKGCIAQQNSDAPA